MSDLKSLHGSGQPIRMASAQGYRVPLLAAAVLALAPFSLFASGYPCLIEPHMVVDLSTAVEGVVESVDIRKGQRVEKGAVIARLESAMEQAMVDQAEARVAMVSLVQAREVSLARHREKLRRAMKLVSQKFVSPDELDDLESAVELARLELETERENKRLAEIDLRRSRAQLDLRTIRSPVDGVVVERYLNPGEFAQAQPIVRIAQLDPLNVEAVLPGSDYGLVRVSTRAVVQPLGPMRQAITAPVTMVEQLIDAASGTFGVRVELPNPDYAIPAGLECTVKFEATARTAAENE